MRKKYIGKSEPLSLTNNKVYEVISIEEGWYRIVDECGEDYLYPPHMFVNEDEEGYIDMSAGDYLMSILVSIEE